MDNTLTPSERLAIYEKMLPYFEGEERLIGEHGIPIRGFCTAIANINREVDIEDFPELAKHDPANSLKLFWFEVIYFDVDHTRTAILHQAISEVKQLINEPAIIL